MYSAMFTISVLLGILGSATAIRLPTHHGSFVQLQIHHPNGSTVNMYLRDSYKPASSIGAHGKRFYSTYHNDTQDFEICAETNFVETSTSDSALSSDCSAIVTELKANPGFFETGNYTDNEYNYLAVCGTCAFGVYRTDGLSSGVNIGSKDVVDNINVSIIRFPYDGHVGATGNFTCNSAPIDWAILRAT
ncbi:putative necrosis-inducing factor-domain-containing protein [Hypoxylon trugodes]|uniref:putative necrosis-inducing factor-domain-containing protein n=1 Tax=Hypoxylon trugodes TaxID=326681 RepID=UPI00219D607E|nr:putative necrosis-inducing factor-domain-containing protein [Hypoxylon trugodes]KAI1383696.1 putative necrosis-inducing factor-domain-containing protein [Hypoxylon trugodes]